MFGINTVLDKKGIFCPVWMNNCTPDGYAVESKLRVDFEAGSGKGTFQNVLVEQVEKTGETAGAFWIMIINISRAKT